MCQWRMFMIEFAAAESLDRAIASVVEVLHSRAS